MRLSFPPSVRSPLSRRASLCASLLSLALVIAGVACGGGSEAVQRVTGTAFDRNTVGPRVLALMTKPRTAAIPRGRRTVPGSLAGQPGVYVINADGSAPARVSPPGASDSDPVWRPVAQ